MSNKLNSSTIGSTFETNTYLDGCTDSASRTRKITIVLIVATVLIGIGFWNSSKYSFTLVRLRAAYDKDVMKSGLLEGVANPDFEKYKENYQKEILKSYLETAAFVRVPVLGFSFDINNLGAIGGISFVIILALMRFSLSREIKNLNVSFKEAEDHNQLCHFYHALAMRQVLTVPEMKNEDRNPFLASSSRYVCAAPIIVFSLGIFYDFLSVFIYKVTSFEFVAITLIVETVCWSLTVYLSWRCWERQGEINDAWQKAWDHLKSE